MMDLKEIIKAEIKNGDEIIGVLDRLTTRIHRHEMLIKRQMEEESKITSLLTFMGIHLQIDQRGEIISLLESHGRTLEELGECLTDFGNDFTDMGEHLKEHTQARIDILKEYDRNQRQA